MLRALRNANCFCRISARPVPGWEKLLKLRARYQNHNAGSTPPIGKIVKESRV